MEALGQEQNAQTLDSRSRLEEFPNEERLLHLLVKGATEYALILVDSEHRIIYWNEGARRIFGYEEKEILGRDIFTLFTPDDIKLEVAQKEIEKASQQGWAEDERWHLRKDGNRFWANGVVTCLKDARGSIIGYSKVLRDQTQRKLTEDRLKSVVAELTQFTYAASHDLREPLRTLSSFIRLVDRDCRGKISQSVDLNLDIARKAAEQLKVLLENLLAFASSTDDHHQLVEKTDTAAVLDMAVSNLKTLIEENNAIVIRAFLPLVNAYPGKLVQVFQNIIANSIKYRRKEENPKIIVDAVKKEEEWLFSIQDNGVGIPPEMCKDIFSPFKRLHSRAEVPGSGLGLSICKRIIEKHKGRIWIESVPGEGSTVFFTLPSGNYLLNRDEA